VPAAGDAVSSHDGEGLGTLTSTDSGWFLGKALAMGYLPAELPSGSVVTVTSADGTAVEASTTHRPFYDPEGTHVRS
jgi:glycine cleavage system aminomethyltransferase T